jgi:hypothetical protein
LDAGYDDPVPPRGEEFRRRLLERLLPAALFLAAPFGTALLLAACLVAACLVVALSLMGLMLATLFVATSLLVGFRQVGRRRAAYAYIAARRMSTRSWVNLPRPWDNRVEDGHYSSWGNQL